MDKIKIKISGVELDLTELVADLAMNYLELTISIEGNRVVLGTEVAPVHKWASVSSDDREDTDNEEEEFFRED